MIGKVLDNRYELSEFIGKGGKILKKLENAVSGTYRIVGDEIYVRARITRICPEMRNIHGGGIGRRRSAWTNPLYINHKKTNWFYKIEVWWHVERCGV